MESLLQKIRFKLVCLLVGSTEIRSLEKFFQNSANYWIKRYKFFEKDGSELQKYAAEEIRKYKNEAKRYQEKYLTVENKYNQLKQSIKRA